MREELDKGNYDEVERQLRTLSKRTLTQIPTRRFVAALWNNLGVQQEKYGGTALSVKAFKRSVSLDRENPLALLNLTQAYWELRDPALTPRFLDTVIRLAPHDPFPHLALADLLLAEGKHALASAHLDQARRRAERDPNHQSYFTRLTERVRLIAPVRAATSDSVEPSQAQRWEVARMPEAPPVRPSPPAPLPSNHGPGVVGRSPQVQPGYTVQAGQEHFNVQFDGPPDQATWIRIRAILNYAYEELSLKFGYRPSNPIVVVLHTNQKFTGTGGSPKWADLLIDRPTGTIHLPTLGALDDLALFSRIARHEFVHALLFQFLRARSTGFPNWLIEGLAMHLAEDPWTDVDEAGQKPGALLPLTALQGDWTQLSGDANQFAYFEARSATQNLADCYGMHGVRQIMTLVQTGQSLDTAMKQTLSVSYEQFHRQWEQTHQASRNARGS